MTNDELNAAITSVVRLIPDTEGEERKVMKMHLASLLRVQHIRAISYSTYRVCHICNSPLKPNWFGRYKECKSCHQ